MVSLTNFSKPIVKNPKGSSIQKATFKSIQQEVFYKKFEEFL